MSNADIYQTEKDIAVVLVRKADERSSKSLRKIEISKVYKHIKNHISTGEFALHHKVRGEIFDI